MSIGPVFVLLGVVARLVAQLGGGQQLAHGPAQGYPQVPPGG